MQSQDVKMTKYFGRIRDTQIDNVCRNLDNAIKRLKMCLILPRMAGDMRSVKEQLKGTVYSPAIKLLEEWKKMDIAKMQVLNIKVIRTIDYFLGNYHIQEKFPWYLNNLSEDDRKLLYAFESIVKVAKRHLWRTSKAEVTMERQLYAMYQEQEKIKLSIALARKNRKAQVARQRWKQAAKRLIAEKMEVDLASRKWKNNMHIQNEIEKRNRLIRDSHRISVAKQRELEEELEKARSEYEKIIKTNAVKEKELRAEKNKLLIQLENLLQKYDHCMREKICENLKLEDEYRVAQKELSDFMVIYRKEEAVYKRIVVKYEEEQRRKQQHRILLFMMNRAARKIQRYWQKWRRDQKVRARKAKKSKKK